MNPTTLTTAQWDQLRDVMQSLYAFTGLGLTAALVFLLGHAILPSLVESGDAPAEVGAYRRVLDPIFVLSLLLTLYAFGRMLVLGVGVLQQYFPRWSI
ncbi:MAG TPA: hypothetical protein VII06_25235 [Chloroflexota bacterium]|jgi:hypothetical protein